MTRVFLSRKEIIVSPLHEKEGILLAEVYLHMLCASMRNLLVTLKSPEVPLQDVGI